MKILQLTRTSFRSCRWFIKATLKVLLVFFVLESIIFNCIGLVFIFSLKDSISTILNAPGSNVLEKLSVNPLYKGAISMGKDGGFVSLLQHTLGRLYLETLDSSIDVVDNTRSDEHKHVYKSISKVGVDVSGAGEALYIYQRLRQLKKSKPFEQLVVDIGANDGFMSSNSFNFIQWGWKAILVEPQESQMELAKKNVMRIKHFTDQVKFLQGVIDSFDGHVPFKIEDDVVSMESHVVRGSSEVNGLVTQVQCYSVKTFVKIFQVPKYFGILSLDAEGSNSKILHQWIELGHRPVYIIYEEIHDPESIITTKSHLAEAGYQYLTKKGWNHIFEYTFPSSIKTSLPDSTLRQNKEGFSSQLSVGVMLSFACNLISSILLKALEKIRQGTHCD